MNEEESITTETITETSAPSSDPSSSSLFFTYYEDDSINWDTIIEFDGCDRRISRAARTLLRKHLIRAQHYQEKLHDNDFSQHQQQQQQQRRRRQQQQKQQTPVLSSSEYLSLFKNNDETKKRTTTKTTTDDSDTVWSLLDHMIGKTDESKCPLLPSLDVWRHDEEHTYQVPISSSFLHLVYPTHIVQHRRKSTSKRLSHWLQCGYCGKTFSTQFYLDIHMQTYHHHSHHYYDYSTTTTTTTKGITAAAATTTDFSQQNQDRIKDKMTTTDLSSTSSTTFQQIHGNMKCPADVWCSVVGLANCHEQALLDEPYYGRGSGGWDNHDSIYIYHKLKKMAHSIPCNVDTIRSECHSTLEACDMDMTLSNFICDTLECPTHHAWQGLLDSASSSLASASSIAFFVPDHWHELWIYESNHHSGFYVTFVLLSVFGWILYYTGIVEYYILEQQNRRNSKKKNHPGNKLLRQKQQQTPIQKMTTTSATTSKTAVTRRKPKFSLFKTDKTKKRSKVD